ncbi:hypothetical protein [Tengunoibacter tsumagoiensis]|uniref:Uncharacterized protein n=1 Tax=Tengunoibacter tsumagoiensis TaxID=2014871 RepID=A0A402A5M8_9CHLR|nr:hypothetical protein [Tengunoibacter tsumagoiensis]GCE14447.1 hypothetical protein KTT_43060 [Tengunoibacter tsumagoiensis]
MNIALRNRQMFALIVVALLTLLVIAFVLLSTAAHINLWHSVGLLLPKFVYPYS